MSDSKKRKPIRIPVKDQEMFSDLLHLGLSKLVEDQSAGVHALEASNATVEQIEDFKRLTTARIAKARDFVSRYYCS